MLRRSLEALRQYWGYDSFRGIQSDIILSICGGHDTLGLMPTGGGKSITFQVPSMIMEGICIVVTPLIALMKDQVDRLRLLGIKAAAIYSGMSHSEIVRSLDNCILGNYKFLYISPERLSSDLFQAKLSHMRVNFITVDEAHCISQWGYDFRPSYLQVSLIRKLKPDAPILALTATATPVVVEDIQRQLKFRKPCVYRMSFERANLTYDVLPCNNKEAILLEILRSTKGSAIVYTRSREQTTEVAKILRDNNISANHYHAGLNSVDKDLRQQMWQKDLVRVMVCTNAFGMGIDKADVRLVVHIGIPDSIEAYFQEAGRAGRDGKPARAILLRGPYDVSILRRQIDSSFPTPSFIRETYQDICFYYQLAVGDGDGMRRTFDLDAFCVQYKLFPVPVHSALRILEQAGYMRYSEPEDSSSCVQIICDRDALYHQHLSQHCEMVLRALMRTYNGLFADLMPIEEALVAQRTKLSPQEVYQALITLRRMSIINYIPATHKAHITFLRSRVDIDEIRFSPEVYHLRRQEMKTRVEAMIKYLQSAHTCRSQMMLDYFGQTDSHPCGKCDVCRSGSNTTNKPSLDMVSQAIVTLLADGHPHTAEELAALPFPQDLIKQASNLLLSQGEISMQDGKVVLQ